MIVCPTTCVGFFLLVWSAQSEMAVTVTTGHYNIANTNLSYDKRVAEDTCSSLMTISNTDHFFFPQGYQHLQRPWFDNPTATAATSAAVSQGIQSLLHSEVEGLDGERVVNIILNLQQNGCLSFLIGDSVRDQFLGELTADILDLESNCDSDVIYHICLDKWGPSKCAQIGERNIVYIGNIKAMHKDTDIIYSDN